ncbi:HIT-like protein [Atractiella rhizophila]|nr:HIT-like protein [Atractiella rhizophila]
MLPFLNEYFFKSCFPGRQAVTDTSEEYRSRPVVKDETCIFCNASKENGFSVVHEEEDLIVFHDRKAGSKLHLLCIPKNHILNVTVLTRADVHLITRMARVLSQQMSLLGFSPPEQQLGFHVPPFFSVNHLHMHGLSLPLNSPKHHFIPSRAKYNPKPPQTEGELENPVPSVSEVGEKTAKIKSFSWFVTARQTVQILNDGGKIGVVGYRIRGRKQ